MDYKFPEIHTIDDVLPFIENKPEFVVAKKDGYTVINYMVSMPDTFGTPHIGIKMVKGAKPYRKYAHEDLIRRECRGIIFDESGAILSRRFHKFFNVNERAETMEGNIDLSQHYRMLDKLDGSMITPLIIRGSVRWGTKMGVTDVSMQVENWIAGRNNFIDFALYCHDIGLTPIFEWCSRENRIVIDHPYASLILLAIRVTRTGEYLSRKRIREMCVDWSLPLVGGVEVYEQMTVSKILEDVKGLEDREGFVLQFDDGHMLKVKTDWYVRIHKAKDKILQEKNVIDLLLNNEADDIKPYLTELDRKRLNRFETDFWMGVNQSAQILYRDWEHVELHKMSRKDLALNWGFNQDEKGMIFKVMDGKSSYDVVVDRIKRSLSTQTKVDSVRHLFGGAMWNDILRSDEHDLS